VCVHEHVHVHEHDVINPIFIVTLIPLFEVTLYPLLRYFKINFSPLRKMTVGLMLAGVSFVCAAILQFEIDVSDRNFSTAINSLIFQPNDHLIRN